MDNRALVATQVTIAPTPLNPLVPELVDRLTRVVQQVVADLTQAPLTLQQLEEQVLRTVKDLAAILLAGLVQQVVPAEPPRTQPCPCGATAQFQRLRPARCCSVLGTLTVSRPYYLCATCHQGHAPLDQQIGWCAGSRSAGLDELLALLGATQDSFAEAAGVLNHLTLVQVAPNTVRTATVQLGTVLVADADARVQAIRDDTPSPPTPLAASGPLCVSLDGVQVHLTPDGWKEVCIGAVYQVHPGRSSGGRRVDALHAEAISYVAELGSQPEAFGWQVYAEAQRRGAATHEVAVVGDGAAWLWTLADLHFPQATQVLDWFHATAYVWQAAEAIWSAQAPERRAWAEQQLAALWQGQVVPVLAELQRHLAVGDMVRSAYTYFTNQQTRMDYPAYRARELPIGSGTIESGCKQLVTSRLKGAGMVWSRAGARQVVKVRAWLRSGRWQEAMALRSAPHRHRRAQPVDKPVTVVELQAATEAQAVADAIAQVRAEQVTDPTQHPWRRAWSRRQQRATGSVPSRQPVPVSSA